MAGKYCRDSQDGIPFIVIDTILPAVYTEQGAAHLTFTGDTQVALHNHLDFPQKSGKMRRKAIYYMVFSVTNVPQSGHT